MNAKIRYWTALSEYDIETAGAMLRTGRFLYVGFMCHQAVEKMLKAAWQAAHISEIPPRTLLIELEPLNVEARYPSHKTALLKRLTKRYCTALVGRSTRLTVWIEKRL